LAPTPLASAAASHNQRSIPPKAAASEYLERPQSRLSLPQNPGFLSTSRQATAPFCWRFHSTLQPAVGR
jgi:hypothetical protein